MSLTNSLARIVISVGMIAALISPLSSRAQKSPSALDTWSGILVSSSCNADEAFAGSPECNKDVPGAEIALYDDTNRVMYSLAPQQSIKLKLGETVTVHGSLEENTITFDSIYIMAIGLNVGDKAPAFSLQDQFGNLQSLDTLKGANGTILLFFRSADW